jgi:hypothetical protein
MPEESVADGVLARLEKGEDIGDVLRDDIERRDGVFFREWMRTTEGWQGVATPAGGAGTAEEPPPRRVHRDDPLNILIYVISDLGLERGDESGLLAYVNLIRGTFPKAKRTEYHVSFLSDKKPSNISSEGFIKDMAAINLVAEKLEIYYDQIHFIGHGLPEVGILFKGAAFNAGASLEGVDSLLLKPDGIIVLFGCYSGNGPLYQWALGMAKKAGPGVDVFAFEDD